MANDKVADRAVEALSDPHFDAGKNHCQVFVRQVVQSLYGNKYDSVDGVQVFYLGTARNTGLAWKKTEFGFSPDKLGDYPQRGDLLYKTQGAGPDGHTGIYVGKVPGHGLNLVAENSYYAGPKIQGYKGLRTLAQFGAVQVVARLPEKHHPVHIYLSGHEIGEGVLSSGHVLFAVTPWAQALGFTADYNEQNHHVTFIDKQGNQSTPDKGITLIGGHGYLPIRDLAEAAGLVVETFDEDHVVIDKA